jgi:shikimate kinase
MLPEIAEEARGDCETLMRHPRTRIYLTGFMGSGKTTVGSRLACTLGYAFSDLDALIEARAGRPVQEIFARDGEAAFRALEGELLRETTRSTRCVISVGGGALAHGDNLEFTRQHGTVVYLRVPVDELVVRLEHGRTARPMLFDADGRPLQRAALEERVVSMLAMREPYYCRAHASVDVGRLNVRDTVEATLRALRAIGDG